jgi:biotin-dependent carboxylase-like uncharacterized protein
MDRRSMELANTLLGNRPDAPVLEIILTGTRLRILDDLWVALAGADTCRGFSSGSAQLCLRGQELEFTQTANGQYNYLAVPGGFHVKRWFGSASRDARNGMGQGIGKGDRLSSSTLPAKGWMQGIARRVSCDRQAHIGEGTCHFEMYPGPQYTLFSEEARRQFIETPWRVSAQMDRTGYRLEGAALPRPPAIDSEPILPGSLQVPGNGLPIITMPDGPTVGGYAKIAICREADLDRLAQCTPGTELTFSWID